MAPAAVQREAGRIHPVAHDPRWQDSDSGLTSEENTRMRGYLNCDALPTPAFCSALSSKAFQRVQIESSEKERAFRRLPGCSIDVEF